MPKRMIGANQRSPTVSPSRSTGAYGIAATVIKRFMKTLYVASKASSRIAIAVQPAARSASVSAPETSGAARETRRANSTAAFARGSISASRRPCSSFAMRASETPNTRSIRRWIP